MLAVSAPVVLVDEVLKIFSRIRNAKLLAERKKIQWEIIKINKKQIIKYVFIIKIVITCLRNYW